MICRAQWRLEARRQCRDPILTSLRPYSHPSSRYLEDDAPFSLPPSLRENKASPKHRTLARHGYSKSPQGDRRRSPSSALSANTLRWRPTTELRESSSGRKPIEEGSSLIDFVEAKVLENAPSLFALGTAGHREHDGSTNLELYPAINAHLHHISWRYEAMDLLWQAINDLLPIDDQNPNTSIKSPRGLLRYTAHIDHDQNTDTEASLTPHINPVLLHHTLFQLNAPISSSSILPDGTDIRFLPGSGDIWKHRLWAGGSLALYDKYPLTLPLRNTVHVLEKPTKLRLTGEGSSRKAFVTVRRSFFNIDWGIPRDSYTSSSVQRALSRAPKRNSSGNLEEGPCYEEDFTLCFLKEPPNFVSSPTKVVKPLTKPDFEHTMTVRKHQLFCWSSLTYNAHLIHLDQQFARDNYGAHDLLVHGPFVAFLAVEFAQRTLSNHSRRRWLNYFHINTVTYKNLQPLYVDQPMKLCMKRKKRPVPGTLADSWDLWIEKDAGDGTPTMAFKAEIGLQIGSIPDAEEKLPTRQWAEKLSEPALKRLLDPHSQSNVGKLPRLEVDESDNYGYEDRDEMIEDESGFPNPYFSTVHEKPSRPDKE